MTHSVKKKTAVAKALLVKRDSDKQLGHRLQTIRKSRGMTQMDVMRLSNLGLTQQVFSKYESGGVRIPAVTLFVFAEVMNVDIRQFFPHSKVAAKKFKYIESVLDE